MMASNEDWVVPAGKDARRFAVFDVSDARRNDHAFFDRLNRQMDGGGLAAMLHDLLALDLNGWHPARNVPQTQALSPERSAVDPWPEVPVGWEAFISHDFGTASPSATYVMARSPGAVGPDGRYYPRGSVVALDELATARPNRPSEGLGWTVPRLAEAIKGMCARWGVAPDGAADDAIFARARG